MMIDTNDDLTDQMIKNASMDQLMKLMVVV
jgi:hypothetical protein